MSVKKRYLGRSTIGALVMTRLALAGPADDLVEKGKAHLEKREYVQASEAFRKAETLAYEDPSDSVATAIKKGLALADAGLLRAAVETQSKTAGNDMAALVELHRLHLRLRTIGGDKSIAADIERAMNIRASLILSEFEKDTAVRNIQPLILTSAVFPSLESRFRSVCRFSAQNRGGSMTGARTRPKTHLLLRYFVARPQNQWRRDPFEDQ